MHVMLVIGSDSDIAADQFSECLQNLALYN